MGEFNRPRATPLAVGLLLAGLLMFAVVGVVRYATGVDSTGGVARVAQSNVWAAVSRPVAPTPIPTANILAIGSTFVDPNNGYKWVWLGDVWLSCRHLDPIGLTYNTITTDPALLAWQAMTLMDKQGFMGVCK